MKKLLLFATLAFLVYAAFSATAVSGIAGCCCDPIVHNGTFQFDLADCPSNYNATALPPSPPPDFNCNDYCNATFGAPVFAPPPPSAGCSSPSFKPAPTNVKITPVKGKRQLTLTWTILQCPAYSINISRCEGDDCEDFQQVARIPPTVVYTDTDPALKWNTTYTYQLVANYLLSGPSDPALIAGNPGDIECDSQGDNLFCVSSFYYERFTQYLQRNGYQDTDANAFAVDFPESVNATFSDKLNKAWKCSPANNLAYTPGMTVCGPGTQCLVDSSGAICATPSICNSASGLFGLYSSVPGCESGAKYCFFDRTRGPVDGCFGCNPRMACADYRTRGTCERDNCHAGDCVWHDVLPDIGIGACVDTRFANCAWCTAPGTSGMENRDSYNQVFDQCTTLKSQALSVPGFPCTFNKNAHDSNNCDTTACMDYAEPACGSPAVPPGITLDPNNALVTGSTDLCAIKVCQLMGSLSCLKNADGNDAPDCPVTLPDRRACELDHFAPNTSLVASGNVAGRYDWLFIGMLDRRNGTDEGALMQGKPGYRLRVCVVASGSPCDNSALFAETNVTKLNFNDLSLQGGKTVLAAMAVGENMLRYYAVDRANNPEIIKNMTITACDKCQGPKVIEVSVMPSRNINDIYYTISDIPVIGISFNEPATMTSAALVSGTKVLPVTTTSAGGANYDYQFIPLTPLPDGAYTFTFTAKDGNGKDMDAPGAVEIVVDTTPGQVTILPPDGTVLTQSSVDIAFIFPENDPHTILDASVEQEVWISKYATRKLPINLLPLLTSEDNITYAATVDDLFGGKKNIKVRAEDFAGNPTIGKSSFWIDTGPLMLRMREPSWGVSASYAFDIIIDTTRVADCRYVYNLPTPPPVNIFQQFTSAFDETTGVTHTISGFSKIAPGDVSAHKLHVYCKLGDNITVESFALRVDPTPPKIKAAYALPKLIIERTIPGQDIFTTSLKVQTDDQGFCKYSAENVPFVLMSSQFPGFDEMPKTANEVEINVTQDNTSYTYYVACKNTAELPSATVPITFSVDTSVAFAATSLTPPYSNTTNVVLRVDTNKRAFCYFGESPDSIVAWMGALEYGYPHVEPVEVNASGSYVWYVKCSTGASGEVASLTIPVVVDTTPPFMLYVNDSSNLPEEPEFSYFADRLQVAFLGTDNETAVNQYYYRVLGLLSNNTILNWTQSVNTNGTTFFVTGLNLTDRNKYRFEAYPVNIVGIVGEPLSSDGVEIDFSKSPDVCTNGVKNPDETDLDCGGQCTPCMDGRVCVKNADCISSFCSSGICASATCDDKAKNANETDVDCGGGVCGTCLANMSCVQDRDCASGACVFGKCGEKDPCTDGVLSGTETDADCGGSCPTGCGEGKNCKTQADCLQGLLCSENTCMGAERPAQILVSEQGPPPMIVQPPERMSALAMFFWFLLIMLILAALGVGGYIGYQYYLEKQAPPLAPIARPMPRPAVPERRLRPWPAVIEKLRGIARHEEPPFVDRDFISLGALAERVKREKVPMREDVFARLNDLVKGKISRREAGDVLAAIRKEPEAFALLRRISFEKLSPAEKAQMRKRLALLKAGKLTPAEIEELLAKLRVTASYYRTHKERLEREFEEWLREGKK